MAMPRLKDKLEVFFGDLIYSIAALSADPETVDLVSRLRSAEEVIRGSLGKKNKMADAALIEAAKRDYTYKVVGATVYTFERSAEAWADGRGREFQAFFPVSPSTLVHAPEKARAAKYKSLLQATQGPHLAPPLQEPAKALHTAWNAYSAAAARVEKANQDLTAARFDVEQAKAGVIHALREVEGLLQARYPQDRRHVASFFRPRKPSKAKAVRSAAAARVATPTDA